MKELFHRAGDRWAITWLFEPRDLWIGVFWGTSWEMGRHVLNLYIGLIPMLPVRVTIVRRRDRE